MSYPCGTVITVTPLQEDSILRLCLIASKMLSMPLSYCLAYCHQNDSNIATLALQCLEKNNK